MSVFVIRFLIALLSFHLCVSLFSYSSKASDFGGDSFVQLDYNISNFIHLVKSPNPVDTLIYKRTIVSRPRFFANQREAEQYMKDYRAGKVKDEELTEVFALRYISPDNYIFQEIDFPTNAWSKNTRLKTFTGRGDGVWWIFNTGGVIATDATNGIYQTDGEDNLIFLYQHQFATEFLRFGMLDLDYRTIQSEPEISDGDVLRFTARSYNGGLIEGSVRGKNGLISNIHYSMPESKGPIRGREIFLTYRNNALHSVRVANIGMSDSSAITYCMYEVLGSKTQQNSVVSGCCDANQFMNDADAYVLIHADGQMFDLKKNPNIPLVRRSIRGQIFGGMEFKQIAVMVVFLVFLIGPLVFLLWKPGKRFLSNLK
jgi:hypothetical protein